MPDIVFSPAFVVLNSISGIEAFLSATRLVNFRLMGKQRNNHSPAILLDERALQAELHWSDLARCVRAE